MKNLKVKNILLTLTLVFAFVLVSSVGVDAAGGYGGYGHVPVDTAIAGVTDQASVFAGIGLYTIGSILIGSVKVLKELIG